MASNIDPTLWDAAGDVSKADIKTKLATPAKEEIEALQAAVDDLSGESTQIPSIRLRGRLSVGEGAIESLTPAEAKQLLEYDLADLTWDPEDTGASTDPAEALREAFASDPATTGITGADTVEKALTTLQAGVGFGREAITATSGSVEISPTLNGARLFDLTGTLADDLTVTIDDDAEMDSGIIIVQRSGADGAFQASITSLAYGGTVALDSGVAAILVRAGGGWRAIGLLPLSLSAGGSDATVAWEELAITTSTALTVADHAVVYAVDGQIRYRVLKIRRASDAALNLTVPNNPGAFAAWRIQIDDSYTSAVKIVRDSSAVINGGTEVTLAPVQGAAVDLWLQSQETGPDVPTYTARGDLASASTLYGALNTNGNDVSGNLAPAVTRGAGSSQPTATDSGKWITSDGALTIPAVAGWNCTLEFGGDHDLTFDGDTWDTGAAAGDIVSVYVKSTTTIRITPKIAAADVITEGDFA